MQILLSHLHCRHDERSRLFGHLKPFGIDQVSMLDTACAKTNRLLTAVGGARVHSNGHAELAGGRCQHLHLVIEPRHARRIVAGAEVAAGVCGFDPVAAEGMLAAHQCLNVSGIIGDGGDR